MFDIDYMNDNKHHSFAYGLELKQVGRCYQKAGGIGHFEVTI